MNITIAKCSADHERIDKSYTAVETVNAIVKEDTSVVDPTFIIHNPGTVDFNYVICSTWKRRYFVRNITALPGERLAVSCHVDVLSSFASGIRSAEAIIDKQEGSGMTSNYINDGSYIMECRVVNQSYNFPLGFTDRSTILITAGGD